MYWANILDFRPGGMTTGSAASGLRTTRTASFIRFTTKQIQMDAGRVLLAGTLSWCAEDRPNQYIYQSTHIEGTAPESASYV